jgi:hypothetical protein
MTGQEALTLTNTLLHAATIKMLSRKEAREHYQWCEEQTMNLCLHLRKYY